MALGISLLFPITSGASGWRDFLVSHQNMEQNFVSEEKPWISPDYSKLSNGSLGYDETTFIPDPEMRIRVDFWKRIYSEFTTYQGVIHDTNHVHLVYESVDFSEVLNNPNLSDREKKKRKRKLVKEAKKKAEVIIRKLMKVKDPSILTGDELRYWKMFESVDEKNKFYRASRKNRIRFQLGQKDRFIQGIFFSGRYLEEMEKHFQEEGLPVELTRLPFVESSFNIFARSRVGASGIWQIMPRTGREYRLKVNSRVDERNDPFKATEAAATILKKNYAMLGNWPLALTAYNHGAYGLRRIVRRLGTKDLTEIIRRSRARRFGFASENFYASFVAALEVEKRANEYLGQVKLSKRLRKSKLYLDRYLSWSQVIEWFGGDKEMARIFNPHLSYGVRKGYFKIPRGAYVRIPEDNMETALAWLKTNPKVLSTKGRTYRVHKGDTLSEIAMKFRIRVSELKQVNDIGNPRSLRVGQKLVIPD